MALLSAFIFQDKTDVEPVMAPHLEEAVGKLIEIADRVGAVQDRHKVSAADTEKKLKFGLVEVVYEWAKGMVSIIVIDACADTGVCYLLRPR